MTFYDMLCMSAGNLWRRKLRTILTVLGVLIGTASIVAMLSIALGMKQMILDSYSSYGSATQIVVSGLDGIPESGSSSNQDSLYLTESNMQMFEELEHVTSVEPTLQLSLTLQQGKYQGWTTLMGVPQSVLESQEVGQGRLPSGEGGARLEVLIGNTVITNFYDMSTDESMGYYDTGVLPDIDFMSRALQATTYNENLVSSDEETATDASDADTDADTDAATEPVQEVDPEVQIRLKPVGIMAGEVDQYGQNSDSVLVDIDALKSYLSKNFKRGQIPGQPKNSKGQPFSEWVYSSVNVNVDESDNVDAVMQTIQDMGFSASSNKELLESAQQTFKIIELVLGGIGMIAFLVAAIGIANTMMMSTYERTKEIGVMKVLGCDMHDILKLFLAEAGFIGFIGGVAGLVFTFVLSVAANALASDYIASGMGIEGGKISVITWWLALVAIVFATFMGMVAGFFPARRAMKLSPLAAIRTE